jgi:hypothetical protein
MSTKVTLNLPDETYRKAENLAQLTGRDINEILTETLDISLQSFNAISPKNISVAELNDADLLAVADSQMDSKQDSRFKALMQRQSELAPDERNEYLALMQVYQEGLLRKAQALNEAVRRGLRKPLEP